MMTRRQGLARLIGPLFFPPPRLSATFPSTIQVARGIDEPDALHPLVIRDWSPALDVDYDRLKNLVKAPLDPAETSKIDADQLESTKTIVRGLAALHVARYLDPEESGDQREMIKAANKKIADILGLGTDAKNGETLATIAKNVGTKIHSNHISYLIPFCLLLHEHFLADPVPRDKLDISRDRAASSRVRVSGSQGATLVRTVCLLLARMINPFSWSVSSEPAGLWKYAKFGHSEWDTSVTGTVMVGFSSAMNMGAFELPEKSYKIRINESETLDRSMFFGAVFDAALLTLKLLTREIKSKEPPPLIDHPLEVDDFRTLTRRGRDGRRQVRLEQIGSGRADIQDLLVGEYTPNGGEINVYRTASSGYSVLTASNLIETMLRQIEQNQPIAKKIGLAFPFMLSGTTTGGSRIWRGVGHSNAGDVLVIRREGRYTGVRMVLNGKHIDPDRVVHRTINAVATMLYQAFGYKNGISGTGSKDVDGVQTILKLSSLNDVPGASLYAIMKFLLAAGYSDSVGPVAWPLDFANLIEHMKSKHEEYFDKEFAILVLTCAYRPLFQTSPPPG